MDTTKPAGKMVFTVLGAVAELERNLIVERVRAGLRNARAKGKRLGRPRVAVDAARIAILRASGLSWPKIAAELGARVSGRCTMPRTGFQKSMRNMSLQTTDSKRVPLGASGLSRIGGASKLLSRFAPADLYAMALMLPARLGFAGSKF